MECSKCGGYDLFVEKDITTGWRMVADKVTCCECGHVEYINEVNEDDLDQEN